MSNLLGTLLVKMALDAADFRRGLDGASGALDSVSSSMQSAGASMQSVGAGLTMGVTMPLVGAATAAVAFATDYNASLANVASLGVPTERIDEFKGAIQDMAIEVGKMPADLSAGMYQIVSAFGDTDASLALLDINARAAAAGLSTTTEAINLTSAVTKGYGDTSAEAVQKVADLAFETVRLGQTTFPELAASMGKVVPLAATLGVAQEELFAQMATLTGVTGNAAEVSTQLRAIYQGILKPTGDMGKALDAVAYSLDQQGKLIGGPLIDAWRLQYEISETTAAKMLEVRNAIAATEAAMASQGGESQALKDAISAQRLETENQTIALQAQLPAIDSSIDSAQAQLTTINDQIAALKLASDARINDMEAQKLALGTSEEQKAAVADLQKQIEEQRLTTQNQTLELRSQIPALEANIASIKKQKDAIRDQITALNLAKDARINDLQSMLGGIGGNEAYAKTLKDLESELKDLEKAQDTSAKRTAEAAAALGPAIINSVGLTDALALLSGQADGNTAELGAMFGSVEALNAVLALSGPQADTYATKLAEMSDVTGAVDDAFEAQTEGVNASGFAMQQAAVQGAILAQKLGDGIAPALLKLLDMAEPLVDWLIDMADQFANADAQTQGWIVGIGMVVAAAGPVLGVLGTLVSTVGAIIGAFSGASAIAGGLGAALAAIGGPVTLVIAAVAGLAVAWNTDFMGMRTTVEGWMGDIGAAWPGFVEGLGQAWDDSVAWMQDAWADTATNLTTAWGDFMDWLPQDAEEMSARTQEVFTMMGAGIEEAFKAGTALASNVWGQFAEWLGVDVDTLNATTVQAMKNTAAQITDGLTGALNIWTGFTDGLQDAWQGAIDGLKSVWDGFAGWITGAVQGVGDTIGGIWDQTGGALGSLWGGGDEAAQGGGGLALAGAGGNTFNITQNFYGAADAPAVRGASRDGVLEALRQIGGR